ncbi:membrane protein insertase YidC, partial [Paenibacillus sepulcri]|nr:membrane protein insertase YidC [Paenibacillus sepulcri]
VLVRLALLPFMISQYKRQQIMKRKMSTMQPEINAIKEKYAKHKDAESQRKQQQETMAVYSKHGYNPLALGCLPMLLQIPILSGLYYAIRMTPDLAQHTFLWFQLGSPDKILPFLAAAVYLLQAKITQSANPPMNGQMGMSWIIYLSPVMMGFFSFSVPAAIPLYWCVGGLIVVLQTMLAKRLYPPDILPAVIPDPPKAHPPKRRLKA